MLISAIFQMQIPLCNCNATQSSSLAATTYSHWLYFGELTFPSHWGCSGVDLCPSTPPTGCLNKVQYQKLFPFKFRTRQNMSNKSVALSVQKAFFFTYLSFCAKIALTTHLRPPLLAVCLFIKKTRFKPKKGQISEKSIVFPIPIWVSTNTFQQYFCQQLTYLLIGSCSFCLHACSPE